MTGFWRFLAGVWIYGVWPAAAAGWAFWRTDRTFREMQIPLPFEIFGTVIAAGFFCLALSISIVVAGLWKKRRGNSKNEST